MSSTVVNVWYSVNTYKKAICKGCSDKLIEGEKILSVSRARSSYLSTSNYCQKKCAEKELASVLDEITPLMRQLISIQETLSTDLKIDESFAEAKQRFGSTLENLGNL
ncbi:MAG TPA: hypothetical protein VNX68_06535 [Nitrosopumilaceae archaeon]|jgi:hypothetical protein|nr:hypothetical protein [Nitrosopumilaceae archaeon]